MRYAYIIRISMPYPVEGRALELAAEEIARVTSIRWGVDGANITFGKGFWKGNFESSAAIEIVTSAIIGDMTMQQLRNHVTSLGLTAFVTMTSTQARELF